MKANVKCRASIRKIIKKEKYQTPFNVDADGVKIVFNKIPSSNDQSFFFFFQIMKMEHNPRTVITENYFFV